MRSLAFSWRIIVCTEWMTRRVGGKTKILPNFAAAWRRKKSLLHWVSRYSPNNNIITREGTSHWIVILHSQSHYTYLVAVYLSSSTRIKRHLEGPSQNLQLYHVTVQRCNSLIIFHNQTGGWGDYTRCAGFDSFFCSYTATRFFYLC